MKLVKFTMPSKKPSWINPETVSTVTVMHGETYICFCSDTNDVAIVTETAEDAVRMLTERPAELKF